MSNINNLTSKIMEDAQLRANSIIDEAKQEESKIILKKVSEAKNIQAQLIEKAKEEAIRKQERIISSAQLKVRNDKLSAKQEMINNVFKSSIEILSNMDSERFLLFMEEAILNSELIGTETLIISNEFKSYVTPEVLKNINDKLVKLGRSGEVHLANGDRNVKSGFIIAENGIEINYTFEELVDSYREEIGYEVANALFN
ncbi:MAG: V-type ATP synthase subunit E [Clostridium sp.]